MAHRLIASSLAALLMVVGCASATDAGPTDPGTPSPEQDLTSLHLVPTVITLPNGGVGTGGIGIDDLGFAADLNRIVVPAGRTGDVDLVDPVTLKVTQISGFSVEKQFHGSHDFGAASVTEAGGLLYVADRTTKTMQAVSPGRASVVGTPVNLAAVPDYVRGVETRHEVWVTEPDKNQIEIFSLGRDAKTPVLSGVVAIDGDGPESLIIDRTRGRAYTNLFSNVSLAIDLESRKVVDRYTNACAKNGTDPNDRGSRGLALDEKRGFLMVACSEGSTSVIDIKVPSGKQVGQAKLPGGAVDIVAFDPVLQHLYATTEEKLVFLGVSANGSVTTLGTVAIPAQARSVVADGKGFVYVGDQKGGGLLRYQDPFAISR